jgi:cell division protein FtsW (lipid II flippase)
MAGHGLFWLWAFCLAPYYLVPGPEGSGVKVNLLGFQPSEIVKYLVIIFLAGFFAANEKFISQYASWSKRLSFFSFRAWWLL